MAPLTVIDTGPLVALLDSTERQHKRVVQVVHGLRAPFITAEPVLAEACFLLRDVKGGASKVLGLVREGLLHIGLAVDKEAEALEGLLTKYADIPMSLADACVVRMVELNASSSVLTFDSDFRVYRHRRNRRIELIQFP